MTFKTCPRCGTQVPDQVVICWNCGECLDPHIIELAESREAEQ